MRGKPNQQSQMYWSIAIEIWMLQDHGLRNFTLTWDSS